MLYESICSENIRLEQEITSIESILNSLPKGKLICARCGKYKKADTRVSAWENCFAILLNLHYCTRAISYSLKRVAYTTPQTIPI